MSRALIQFELRPVEDRNATITNGFATYRDVEFIKITPPGGGLVAEKEVTQELLDSYRFHGDPGMKYRFEAYMAWKENREAPINGTPLSMWPNITPAQLKHCQNAKIRSVEELAEIPDGGLKPLGLDARTFRDKAREWIKTATNGNGKIIEEMAAIKASLEDIKKENERLRDENISLSERLGDERKAPRIKLKSAS